MRLSCTSLGRWVRRARLRAALLACLVAACALGPAADQRKITAAAADAPPSWLPTVSEPRRAASVQPDRRADVAEQPALSRAQGLAGVGYVEREFLLSGVARRYAQNGDWGRDGRWSVQVTTTTPYVTRVLVRRPIRPERFNGIVVVEWLNTTLGSDFDGEWATARREFVREGYAWVGVTAQRLGMESLKSINPARYASLDLASDDYSYDIFSQAGRILREHAAQIMGDLQPDKLLAAGYSKSAVFLTTYANAIQPAEGVYDGFFMHGRAPFAAPLNDEQVGSFNPQMRSDLDVPVFQLQTEMEVAVSWPLSETADTDRLRYWEVAGAAHFDRNLQQAFFATANHDLGEQPPDCLHPLNDLPAYEVAHAAWHALRLWVTQGKLPPRVSRLQRHALGFVSGDENGHAEGGVRLPEVAVPLARYGIYSNFTTGSLKRLKLFSCIAGGSTAMFSPEKRARMYPTTQAYLLRYRAAADAALEAGFLRPADYEESLSRAGSVHAATP